MPNATAQHRIATCDLLPPDQNDQTDILDEIHRQQMLRDIHGHCDGGCRPDHIIYGWPFAQHIKNRHLASGGFT